MIEPWVQKPSTESPLFPSSFERLHSSTVCSDGIMLEPAPLQSPIPAFPPSVWRETNSSAECVCFRTGSPEPAFSVLNWSYSYSTPKTLKLLLYPSFPSLLSSEPSTLWGITVPARGSICSGNTKKNQTKPSLKKQTKNQQQKIKRVKHRKASGSLFHYLSYCPLRKESSYPSRQVIYSKVTWNRKYKHR